jgi:hypothetical protein
MNSRFQDKNYYHVIINEKLIKIYMQRNDKRYVFDLIMEDTSHRIIFEGYDNFIIGPYDITLTVCFKQNNVMAISRCNCCLAY